jgi:PAS domain S-box-containing protein
MGILTDSIRVLHVDDEPGFAEMTATFLEREAGRLEIETEPCADEGHARLVDGEFDCVISDYDMPGRNGLEFLELVREEHPDLPFILYTGKGSEEVASDAISAGATDYLQKQSDNSQYTVLANRITNAVEQYRANRERHRRRARQKHQGEALLELTTDEAVIGGDFETALERITETAATVLDVPRVNVWLFDGDDRRTLRCVDHFDGPTGAHESDLELVVENCPAYFEVLESNRSIVVPDVTDDPRTAELREYLEEHGVGALLDSTIRSEGDAVGVVCHEHTGGPREWTDDEIEFANDVAELVHRALRNRERVERRFELERTQARFRALTENTTHAVVTIDANSTVKYANDAVEDVLGYPASELVNGPLSTIMPERVHEGDETAIDRFLQDETRRVEWDWIELPGLHRDGHEVPLGISFGETTVDGEQRFTALVRDISDHKERERELERTRDLLQQTERIADVGGWELDPDTLDVFWTEPLFELSGVAYDEEPSLDGALDIFHEADRPTVEDAVDRALDSGESFDIEAQLRRPDGEARCLRIRGMPTVEDGEVVTLRGAVQDITDQKRHERVLREMHDIISNRHRSFEEQIQALLELGRRELDTEYGTLSEIRDEEYVFEFVDADDESIQAGDVVPVSATNCEIVVSAEETLVLGDVERDTPDETDRAGFSEWGISCYIGAPVFVEDEIYGTFCFYDTEPRADQFSDWEETLVDLMSSWVSYELQRRRVNERLQKQNEQLTEFTSIASHDLRNPLNVAQGRLELAVEECDSEHLDDVVTALDRMETLIEDLLTLARKGERIEAIEPVEFPALLENCWRHVDTSDATLNIEAEGTIRADRNRLQQLLENLFRNAVEHGRDDVSVTVGAVDDGFAVEDDGPGIPEAKREDVFDAGYSTAKGGSGFGLSIVQQVADAHGWRVRVTNGSEGGARFEITGIEFAAE